MEHTEDIIENRNCVSEMNAMDEQYDTRNENASVNYNEMDNIDVDANLSDNCTYVDNGFDEGLQHSEINRIQALEEEQESLLSSLMALTTHFAQVQFRLHQIVEAPEKERDTLLKKLEDFADRGIPNWHESTDLESKSILTRMDSQKGHQQELIEQLKTQLDDLEKYAYETGEPVLPQAVMVEKQRIIIEGLKEKMNFNFNELDLPQLSPDELRNHVDAAFGEFVSPLKMKEQLVGQLKTQVNDLERFIKFLQGEKCERKKSLKQQFYKKQNCTAADIHNKTCNCNFTDISTAVATGRSVQNPSSSSSSNNEHKFPGPTVNIPQTSQHGLSGRLFQMFNKASTILQIFALSQMGCSSQNGRNFKKNILKKTTRGNHWGDTRAKLEVDIQEIILLVSEINKIAANEDHLKKIREQEADTDDDDVFVEAKTKTPVGKMGRYRSTSSSSSQILLPPSFSNVILSSKSDELKSLSLDLIALVRKKFAVTLQRLVQHGLRSVNETRHLVPFISCFANYQTGHREYPDEDYKEMHAWELILEYYHLKNGDYYTETPAQKLSQSFNLEISGDGLASNKQTLLLTIRNIITLHSPYKRSYHSHFKAFVCAGLNSHKLVQWLNLIFQCHELVSLYYTSWSYVAQTGFRDALKSIDQLTKYDFFDLPVDAAVRNLANIKDVFS